MKCGIRRKRGRSTKNMAKTKRWGMRKSKTYNVISEKDIDYCLGGFEVRRGDERKFTKTHICLMGHLPRGTCGVGVDSLVGCWDSSSSSPANICHLASWTVLGTTLDTTVKRSALGDSTVMAALSSVSVKRAQYLHGRHLISNYSPVTGRQKLKLLW